MKKADRARPHTTNPEIDWVGIFLFLGGALVVFINLTMHVDGGSGILNPFLWGALGLYGAGVIIHGAPLKRKRR